MDLNEVQPCLSGPKRPHDRILLKDMKKDFNECLPNKLGFKGFDVPKEELGTTVPLKIKGQETSLKHGSVVIAAITSCTNTSNPSVMLQAAMLCKNATAKGIKVHPYVKTSLSPGSGVVQAYLEDANLLEAFESQGFYIAGFGCMTCIGNSGDLDDEVTDAITDNNLVACAVLSGNRNFEARIHPLVKGS